MLKRQFFLLLILFFSIASFAQTDGIPDRPNPPRLVNNLSKAFPNFISGQEQALLEKKLQDFANQTSNQIEIVIVDDLAGLEAYDYATRLGQKWGVGQAKADNGIIILVKPTERHELFIAPGYGLQGAIPDLTTKQIRENEMNPYLKKGQNFTAFDKGTDVLMALAKGEYNSDAYGKKKSKNKIPFQLIIIIIIVILVILFGSKKGGSSSGGGLSMGSGFLLGSMFGSGFGGSGGGGGGSSGGFGGFGGGGFGGGGSGGSW